MTDHAWINDKGEGVDFPSGDTAPPTEDEIAKAKFQNVETIAELGWTTHIAWERIIGEQPKPEWDDLPDTKQREICDYVVWMMEHPAAHIAAQHDRWRAGMAIAGKVHPNAVEYDELPWTQQMKAKLWRHVLHAFVG